MKKQDIIEPCETCGRKFRFEWERLWHIQHKICKDIPVYPNSKYSIDFEWRNQMIEREERENGI